MTEYWFKPKTHGYGATPMNWKGWAATALFALAVDGFATTALSALGPLDSASDYAIVFGGVAAITVPFVWLCRIKTNGPWRWQWGHHDGGVDR